VKQKSVAIGLVEKAGVKIDELIDLLVRSAAAELTTFYYDTIFRTTTASRAGRC
jgi:ferritin-like protein